VRGNSKPDAASWLQPSIRQSPDITLGRWQV
jgi:hypothetical protein